MMLARAVNVNFHLLPHLFYISLSVLYHLNCFLPFHIKCYLRVLNFFLLYLNPLFQLLFLSVVCPRRHLLILIQFPNKFGLLFLSILQSLLSHSNYISEIVILINLTHLLDSELLEWIFIKDRLTWLACMMIEMKGLLWFNWRLSSRSRVKVAISPRSLWALTT